jgi:uncharacterized protein
MRRTDRQISQDEALAILEKGEFGVLSTVSADGSPYGVPVNFCHIDGCIYFHSALTGTKVDNIGRDPRVSFCVIGGTEILPSKFATRYESCVVQGTATEVFAGEKQAALEGLVLKYSPEYEAEGRRYIESQTDNCRVFKVTVSHVDGKARR